jgi:hypothetical protein
LTAEENAADLGRKAFSEGKKMEMPEEVLTSKCVPS